MPKIFLMTDVVGSTQLWERHTDVMAGVLERHDEIVHGAVKAAGGRVFKHTGDGMIAVFDDAAPAVGAALESVQRLDAEDWAIVEPIRIRSSIHAGTVSERDGDFFGPALNRLARMNGVAHPDQVVASDIVHQLLPESKGMDLGKHQLRDLGEPARLWQLDDGDHPPLRSMRDDLNNLPVQLTEFIGRDAETQQLDELLAEHRLVTISGVGGCGKTRIAVEVAAHVSGRYDGGCWFADLRSAADPDEIVQQIALAIGLVAGGATEGTSDLRNVVIEYSERAPTLIVLDNCEHLVDDAADVADELLRGAASLTILATSREALGTDGERVWRIPSMAADSGEARELFLSRASAATSEFSVGDEEVELIDRICAQLDGIPLAIELAAARVSHLSLAELEAGLDQRFSLLSGGRRARRQRQQTLQAMMDWSWDLLDDDEQTLLTELSVFRGGFDVSGIEAVCAKPQVGSRFEVLTSLVDRSLVQVTTEEGATSRYQLLETVRLYGLDRLTGAGAADIVRDRHAAWVRERCSSLRPLGGFEPVEMAYWMANAENLLAAADWFVEQGDDVAAAEVLSGRPLIFQFERNVDGLRWFTPEFVGRDDWPSVVGLALCQAAAVTATMAGDYPASRRFAELGVTRFEELDLDTATRAEKFWGASSLCYQGTMMVSSDLEGARGRRQRAEMIVPGLVDSNPIVNVLDGLIAMFDRDFETAADVTKPSGPAAAFGTPGTGVTQMIHAMALSWLGRHEEAAAATSIGQGRPGVILGRTPNAVGVAQVAWVVLRSGRVQEAFDLIARPSRLAIGAAVVQWRAGRAFFLAEYALGSDPELAVRLAGCAPEASSVTMVVRRRDLLERAADLVDRPIDDLLAEGAAAGEDATVAEAHEMARAAGLSVE